MKSLMGHSHGSAPRALTLLLQNLMLRRGMSLLTEYDRTPGDVMAFPKRSGR